MRSFLIILLTALSGGMLAQTNVSGLISSNTTWTASGSPYIVTGTVVVGSNSLLTINAGVDVLFNEGTSMGVQGELRVNGTAQDSVSFLPNTSTPYIGYWGGVKFFDTSIDYNPNSNEGCQINYAIITFAGDTGTESSQTEQAGIEATDVAIKVSNCHVSRCNIGIRLDGANASLIEHNLIDYHYLNGLFAVDADAVSINTNWFIQNGWANGGLLEPWHGLFVTGVAGAHSWSVSSNSFIENKLGAFSYFGYNLSCSRNLFYHNFRPTLATSASIGSPGSSSTNELRNNIFANGDGGFSVGPQGTAYTAGIGACSIASKNQFIDNTDNKPSISIGNTIEFSHNTICRNRNDFSPLVSSDAGLLLRSCNFRDNEVSIVIRPYEGTGTVNAQENWWGTSVESDIQTQIYDFFDDSSLPLVDYSNYLAELDTIAPVTPVVNVLKTNLGGGQIQLCWSNNLEEDLAGYRVYYGNPTGYSFANSIDVGNVNMYNLSGVNLSDTIAVTAYDISADGFEDQFDGYESWFTIAENAVSACGLVGIETTDDNSMIKVYPNPTSGAFLLETGTTENYQVEVFNALGQSVFSQQYTQGQAASIELTSVGIYHLRVFVEDEVHVMKVVKE